MFWAAVWYWILAALTFADLFTTQIILSLGGSELNQNIIPYLDNFTAIKIFFLIVNFALVIFLEKMYEGYGWMPAASASCMTFMAVISNITQICSYFLTA